MFNNQQLQAIEEMVSYCKQQKASNGDEVLDYVSSKDIQDIEAILEAAATEQYYLQLLDMKGKLQLHSERRHEAIDEYQNEYNERNYQVEVTFGGYRYKLDYNANIHNSLVDMVQRELYEYSEQPIIRNVRTDAKSVAEALAILNATLTNDDLDMDVADSIRSAMQLLDPDSNN